MRRRYVAIIIGGLLALCGCNNQIVTPNNVSPGNVSDSAIIIIIDEAEVAEFRVQPPRSIVFSKTVQGFTQVWLDESTEGDGFLNNTETFSRNGCPLAGPPIQAGDSIKVSGHLNENGQLIADTIWLLNVEIDATDCTGPLPLTPDIPVASTPTPIAPGAFLPLEPKKYRVLPQKVSWQIQYTDEIDIRLDVDVFNLDLFDTPPDMIEALHRRDVFVMCYFSAGSYEDWRPDSSQFSSEVLGKDMEGWPGEKWLDIRHLDLLAPIMEARLDLAVQKGCDGVDPDNVNGYANDTGFPLTYDDQITYNVFLAQAAHSRGVAIGLKNDLEQIPDLLPYFDWILNEECFTYNECDQLLPFIQADKPVLVIEYQFPPQEFCPQANQMGFSALHKNRALDAYRTDCQQLKGQEASQGSIAWRP